MAAVGRKNGRVGRPAVILSASVARDQQEPDQDQHVVAMPQARPEPPDPGQQDADDEAPRAAASRRSWRRRGGLPQAERVDLLDVRGVNGVAVADDDLALADRDADRRDGLGGLVARLSVRAG